MKVPMWPLGIFHLEHTTGIETVQGIPGRNGSKSPYNSQKCTTMAPGRLPLIGTSSLL